jgi:DHA1 family tetracycline resistance protein-like MFS transporter
VKLPRALIPIYGITFLDILGFTILIPLLPFLAKRFGAPDVVAGSLITTTALFATLSSPLWGALSDRYGRKPALLGSQVASFIGYLLLAFADGIPLLFVSRVVEGLGGGNLGVANSYIADVTSEAQRPRAFAYATAAFGAGFIVGPILGGALAHIDPTLPFFVAAALQFVNFVSTALLLPNTNGRVAPAFRTRDVLASLRDRAVANVLAREFLYIFAFTYFFTIFSLYLARVLREGPAATSFLLGIAGAVGAAVQIAGVAPLVRRFGTTRVALGAFAAGIVAYVMLGLVHELTTFVLAIVIWAASGSLLRPVLAACLSDVVPERERGMLLGFSGSLDNFALIFAPAIGSAIVGVAPQLTGIVPAVALAAGFWLTTKATRDDPGSLAM